MKFKFSSLNDVASKVRLRIVIQNRVHHQFERCTQLKSGTTKNTGTEGPTWGKMKFKKQFCLKLQSFNINDNSLLHK